MHLQEIIVRPVKRIEESIFQELMQVYHYLGSLPKIGNIIWYVATYQDQWQALLTFSAAALKCGARDQWIGWCFRHQYDRLNLLTNNSRFLILPDSHQKNLASIVSVIHYCYWKLLLIRHDSMEQFTRLQTGGWQVIVKGISVSAMDTIIHAKT